MVGGAHTAAVVEFDHVTKVYAAPTGKRAGGPTPGAVNDLSMHVPAGKICVLVGPSGCGKTTLLNLLAGYDAPTSGHVERAGALRMVHQQDGLFPWRTAAENIEMGLRHVGSTAERARQRDEMLALIGLEGFAGHYPHQLSGGMRQRVELARALAGETDILLLDEPFSALDYITRLRMRHELSRLLHERPRTVVLVTHDIEEAAQRADRVIVLSGRPGRIRSERSLLLPRPRDLTHPEVVETIHAVLVELGLERRADGPLPPDIALNEPGFAPTVDENERES
jgi:ABC-type nitrate/sulfonate/bicarbonate transport system ATPase subunit